MTAPRLSITVFSPRPHLSRPDAKCGRSFIFRSSVTCIALSPKACSQRGHPSTRPFQEQQRCFVEEATVTHHSAHFIVATHFMFTSFAHACSFSVTRTYSLNMLRVSILMSVTISVHVCPKTLLSAFCYPSSFGNLWAQSQRFRVGCSRCFRRIFAPDVSAAPWLPVLP